MTVSPPLQLIIGPPTHGVTHYALDLAVALERLDPATQRVEVADVTEAAASLPTGARVHAHVTDRLFGDSPESAADALDLLAAQTRLTVTLHDVPQRSDGRMLTRRRHAYARFCAAAEAVAVNSEHERHLLREYVDGPHDSVAIVLGTRNARPAAPPPPATTEHDLVVLLAGFVYPGKGHGPAIRAAAQAAGDLRARGRRVGDVIVRALGAPSFGHEGDIADLRDEAAQLGARFEITGYLDADRFWRELAAPGIPLAAHEHVSASRSVLDWMEAGRRPLVADSRYAAEMDRLRPATMVRYPPDRLADEIARTWEHPRQTWLPADVSIAPTLDDAAARYLQWWNGVPT
jgi:hypothetical protein